MWRLKSKLIILSIVLSLLLLVSLSPWSYAEPMYLIAESELTRLEELQMNSEQRIKTLEELITNKESSYQELLKVVIDLKIQTESDKLELTNLKEKLQNSLNLNEDLKIKLDKLEQTIQKLEQYIKQLEKEVRLLKIKYFLRGFAAGIIAGFAASKL